MPLTKSKEPHTIFISGTPGVGKSTVATLLQERLSAHLTRVNEYAQEKGLLLGEDEELGYQIVDIEALCNEFKSTVSQFSGISILEGHLSHFCQEADVVIILRAHPSLLEKRLAHRNYSPSKVKENLEAEAMAVCSVEAYEIHGDKVHEIDTSDLSPEDVVDTILKIWDGKKQAPVGEVDFLEWIIS